MRGGIGKAFQFLVFCFQFLHQFFLDLEFLFQRILQPGILDRNCQVRWCTARFRDGHEDPRSRRRNGPALELARLSS